jgi:diketogulonate reductase-like aldo/keto reductase
MPMTQRSSVSRARFLRGLCGAGLLLAGGPATGVRAASPQPLSSDDTMNKLTMTTRAVPRTGEAIPVIGLGTWQTFDVNGDTASRQPLTEVLQLLLSSGGRVIDSSPMYGRAEAVTGDLLAQMGARPKAFLATKVWTSGRERGIQQMRRSAQLLRTDVIDLMQIHNLLDWQTHLPTLRDMKAAGRIRYIGVTHYTTGALADLAGILEREADIDFVQLGYSIATRDAEARLLPVAQARGVAVIVNQPFEEGALFRDLGGRPLPGWAQEIGCKSWAQFFLKYILGHPAVTCVIPATASPSHMADDLAAGIGPLPDESQRQRMLAAWLQR